MKTASITHTKNHLSKLIDEVRNGEQVIILDRDVPVARLVPIAESWSGDEHLHALARSGVATMPESKPDAEAFLHRSKPAIPADQSAVETLVRERRESR